MWALARAYHNWAHDFCSADPTRLKMVVELPPYDLERAVEETRRAVTELGAITVMMPRPQEGRFWHYPEYDAFWDLVTELDMPVTFHGAGSGSPHAGHRYRGLTGALFALNHAIGFPMENMISMGHLIFTGILQKHPTLRVSFLEGNAGWLPFWLGRLDDHSVGRQGVFWDDNNLEMTPTEFFKRQIFVAADADEEALPAVVSILGDSNLIWNTDYPHTDAPAPDVALPELLHQPITDDNKRKILWDNPVPPLRPPHPHLTPRPVKKPIPNSYWVKPGRLAAGEYPGDPNPHQARRKLRALLEANISFFIDLTEIKDGLDPYNKVVEHEARTLGMCVHYKRYPIVDVSIPKEPEDMIRILDAIDHALGMGHSVYVHCWGGVGRTGTAIGCWLVRHGLTGEEALRRIDKLWQGVEKAWRIPNSPETCEQQEYVRNWHE